MEMGRRGFLQATAAAVTATGLTGLGSGTAAATDATTDTDVGPRWVARHGLTASEYQSEFEEHVGNGYRLTDVGGYGVDGQARYAAIWEKRGGPAWIARHGLTASEYQNVVDRFVDEGYRVSHVSGYSVDDRSRYATIMEKGGGPAWVARHGLSSSEYQDEFEEHVGNGHRLVHVSGHGVDGRARYAAIWEKRGGPAWVARHDLTASQYEDADETFTGRGYRPAQVSAFSVDGEPRFAAIWEKGGGPERISRHGLPATEYQDEFDELAYQGYRPVDVSGYAVPDTVSTAFGTVSFGESARYAGIWEADGLDGDDIDWIDSRMQAYMNRNDVPGLSVAITKDERLVFAKGYGLADRDAGEEVRPSHRFRIASISKPVTAVAVMQLVEAGRLDLDDFVFGSDGVLGTTYGTPSYGRLSASDPDRITVKHLLEHTAGWWVRNNPNRPDPMFRHPNKDQDELIRWVVGNWPLDNEPGTDYSYLNFGYCVLGRVIEAVTGRSYESYVADAVLGPCGIDGMEIAGDTRADRKDGEVVYYGRSPYDDQVSRMDAHGGWIATPIDLLRFVTRVDGFDRKADILRPETERELSDREGPNCGYGEGWILQGNWRGHDGSLSGSRGYLVRRDDGFSFAVLTNGDGSVGGLRTSVNSAINSVRDWPSYDLF
ncbi:serine hydrolase [Halobacteriales archaeon QH_1_68_42]|nr:MAG: serine hydrolase [Halobacteriales archaeon QH_1_68_42]